MVTRAIAGYSIGDALAAVGLLPKECRNVEFLNPADGVMCIRYEINITAEDLPKIAEAYRLVAEQVKV